MKKEKGAITLFVLIAILFFIIVLINLLIVTANRANKQVETTKQAVDIYGKSVDEIEDLYKSYFGDSNVIPIYTAEELQILATLKTGESKNVTIKETGKIYSFSLDKVYVLRNDIDASTIGEWTAIGTRTDPFNGILEGANHIISGISIYKPNENYQGLFGEIAEQGEVRNVKATEGEVEGARWVGGIAGLNRGKITNCSNELKVISQGKVQADNTCLGQSGGIVGTNYGIIENCINLGTIKGARQRGGIAGFNAGTITNSQNKGEVLQQYENEEDSLAGGIAGLNGYKESNSAGIIINCTNEGAIYGNVEVGGIAAGNQLGEIKNSKNMSSAITGTSAVGGIAGYAYAEVTDCTNYGTITSSIGIIGGIVGRLEEEGTKVENCTNEGNIVATNSYRGVGGIIGANYSTTGDIINCTNKGEISGGDYVGGIVGFMNDSEGSIESCNNTAEITGTGEWAAGIAGISKINIISCSNTGNVTTAKRAGGITGQQVGKEIIRSYNTGTIINTGAYNAAGIAAEVSSAGKISKCYNTGNITGTVQVGGIASTIFDDSIVTECYNTGTITSTTRNENNNVHTGGIAGRMSGGKGVISYCYNTGTVRTTDSNGEGVGGIVGFTGSAGTTTTSYCYNTGGTSGGVAAQRGSIYGYQYTNQTTTNCYYLSTATGAKDGASTGTGTGTSRTAAQLQASTMITSLGGSTYWSMDTGNINNGYPVLAWQE